MHAEVIWGEESKNPSEDNIQGSVKFYQKYKESIVHVRVSIKGLQNGFHGFHIHEKKIEDFTDDTEDCCNKLGGHFNVGEKWSPENQCGTRHGKNGHNGDLCNNIYSFDGICLHSFGDDKISLFERDERCVVGRSIVIHKDPDDMGLPIYNDEKKDIDKFITGNAGKRIACGNIEIYKDD